MLEPAGTAEIRGSKVDATNIGDKRRMPSRNDQVLKGVFTIREVHRYLGSQDSVRSDAEKTSGRGQSVEISPGQVLVQKSKVSN